MKVTKAKDGDKKQVESGNYAMERKTERETRRVRERLEETEQ